jgi:hypothetical protein
MVIDIHLSARTEKALRAVGRGAFLVFRASHLTQDVALADRLSGLADRLRNLSAPHGAVCYPSGYPDSSRRKPATEPLVLTA